KTIFILTYDENDGYFDHAPTFIAPEYSKPATGKVSEGIDTRLDYVKMEQDVIGPIGLGYRVPLVIASPWSRGGCVNSQVFDHTSTLQFLETFLNKKFGKNIEETNITKWRRTVCGDLTSTFQPYKGEAVASLPFLKKDLFIESIHKAKFKNVPSNYKSLTAAEIDEINKNPNASQYIPQQEKGIRNACALPYELYADGNINVPEKKIEINLKAGNKYFKDVNGAPFIVHAHNYSNAGFAERNYALIAGDELDDSWPIAEFNNNNYNLHVHGPNGFFRAFKGDDKDPDINVSLLYHADLKNNLDGNIQFSFVNNENKNHIIEIIDNAYHQPKRSIQLNLHTQKTVLFYLDKSYGWYDFTIRVYGNNTFEKRYAGHVETGKASKSDPLMGMIN
ncbi:MAG TPA: phospholipase domain-containing protein, partial [Parafilimonas sp.]